MKKISNKKKINIMFAIFYFVFFATSVTIFYKTYSEFVTNTYLWDGTAATSYSGGDGTQTSPYLINDAKELTFFRNQVDGGATYANTYFQLTRDIDLNDTIWNPVGTSTIPFRGTFDGAGHTISNIVLDTPAALPTNVFESWGFFASLGGGNSTATIKNVVFDKITINNNFAGNTSNNTVVNKGIHMGTVVGTMFKYSSVLNVIVKNSSIYQPKQIKLRSFIYQYFVGGLVGYAVNDLQTYTDPGYAGRYKIDNCAVDTDIHLYVSNYDTSSSYYYESSQFAIGGIIGGVRGQAVAPTNSLYEGAIYNTRNGFIGPIFGYIRGSNNNPSNSNSKNTFTNLYKGNNAGTLPTMTSYYTDYYVNEEEYYYTTTESNSLFGVVHGVNKGNYTSAVSDRLGDFNNNTYNEFHWTYSSTNGFDMEPKLTGVLTESPTNTYNFSIQDYYNSANYASTWYIDGIQTDVSGNSKEILKNFDYNTEVKIVTELDNYYGIYEFIIPKYYISATFHRQDDTITATVIGDALPFINSANIIYKWYKEDISGTTKELVSNTNVLTDYDSSYEYGIELSYPDHPGLTTTVYYKNPDRVVVYVDNNVGSDLNSGATPNDPVKSMEYAYSLLNSSNNMANNIIVIMGNYFSNDYMYTGISGYETTLQRFNKKVTITGKINGTDYGAGLYTHTADNASSSSYLMGDTTFQYLTFYGTTTTTATNGSAIVTTAGHNLVMGEGLYMKRYSNTNISNYAMATGTAPDFHIVGGYADYNQTSLPRNNGSIIIKSGAYARIIAGTRNTKVNNTSHNFTGTSSEHFVESVNVDIKNSTKQTFYTYDVNIIVAGQTDGSIYGNIDINVNNGSIGRIVGGSQGNSRQIPGYPSNSFIGSTKIYIKGGSVNDLFGGSLGRARSDVYYYGTIETNISGGTINNNIYGAGAGGATGYNIASSDPYKSQFLGITTSSTINITGGTINGNIYGGGYGRSEYLDNTTTAVDGGALYGNSFINISGGTINGSIYGAGKGYDGYGDSDLQALGQMIGNTKITVSGNPSITGSIYGAGEGSATYAETAKMTGASEIIMGSSLTGNIYGGGNVSKLSGNTKITVTSAINGNIYGGGKSGTVSGNSVINLNGGSVIDVYGGGYSAGINTSTITLAGSTVQDIYGGSYEIGNVTSSNINANSGSARDIYGGNNMGGNTGSTDIVINGADINGEIYGGGNATGTTSSKVTLTSSTERISAVYGGGKSANVNSTQITINGAYVDELYGGSNVLGNVNTSTVTMSSGDVNLLYGGNNVNGKTSRPTVTIAGGRIGNLVGGGNSTDADKTTINVNGGNITNIFGGSDTKGNVGESEITTTSGTIGTIYGGNDIKGKTTLARVTINGGTINSAIYGGGLGAETSMDNSYVNINTVTNKVPFIFGGGSSASVGITHVVLNNNNSIGEIYGGSNTSGSINQSNIHINNGVVDAVYGGNNANGRTETSNVTIANGDIGFVYGGNNENGTTGDAVVTITGGTIGSVYGGGDLANTDSTVVNITNAEIEDYVYGGGNNASVIEGTDLNIITSNIGASIFGGGNAGSVGQNTDIFFSSSSCGESIYAGGNGVTAIVFGSSLLNIDGTSQITENVFGGGNAADTGVKPLNNIYTSNSVVNIVGANIGGNVYGGANTSAVYGSSHVNIGQNAVNNNALNEDDIVINGTVFGGGEANASGDDTWDWKYNGVYNGTTVLIDAANHDTFDINGSIFGSGNNSVITGTSVVNIKNFGTYADYKTLVSLQRTDMVIVDNSAILLTGTTDSTSSHASTLFSVNIIDELKIKNNSTLFFENGANLLNKFTSLVDINNVETKAEVTINDTTGSVSSNVVNRLYAYEGVNINVAVNEANTSYGEVTGMTFFGLFNYDDDNKIETALYSNRFTNNSTITSGDAYYFTSGSYVSGLHLLNHNIKVDGFYSNYAKDGLILQKYINPAPEDSPFYMWYIGELVTSMNITLTASKYSTLGTSEVPLPIYSLPNTILQFIGFRYDGINEGVSLVPYNTIPRVAATEEEANNTYGLTVKTGVNGWLNNGSTEFYTDEDTPFGGTLDYNHENSSELSSIIFYLYHSKNITGDIDQEKVALGKVVISLIAVIPDPTNDLKSEIKRININVKLYREYYNERKYEGSVTTGKKYELFAPNAVDITSKSTFSAYYSLFYESANQFYQNGYHHTLVSTYVLPENTKITMIDLGEDGTPKYYYYIVSAADVIAATSEHNLYGESSYDLTKFKVMGSNDNTNIYNEAANQAIYYDSSTGFVEEEFIFMLDFSQSNITQDVNANLTFELRDGGNQTIVNVMSDIYNSLQYHLHYNKDAAINLSGTINKERIYSGESAIMNITTVFNQQLAGSSSIVDTNFYNQKLGLKISIIDANGNLLNGTSLMGISYTYKDVIYYPSIDGSVRINIAEKVANVASKITLNSNQNTIATGIYTIRIESFGSPDGIYYGLVPSRSIDLELNIVDDIYGLKSTTSDNNLVIDSVTGNNLSGNNSNLYILEYASGLNNPKITMALQRRKYDNVSSLEYESVDLQNYVSNELVAAERTNEYIVSRLPIARIEQYLYFNNNLSTGTYKLIFKLYDYNIYVGEDFKYLIIK